MMYFGKQGSCLWKRHFFVGNVIGIFGIDDFLIQGISFLFPFWRFARSTTPCHFDSILSSFVKPVAVVTIFRILVVEACRFIAAATGRGPSFSIATIAGWWRFQHHAYRCDDGKKKYSKEPPFSPHDLFFRNFHSTWPGQSLYWSICLRGKKNGLDLAWCQCRFHKWFDSFVGWCESM